MLVHGAITIAIWPSGDARVEDLLDHKTEIRSLRPDLVPLGFDPLLDAGNDIVVGAEGEHVRMEQRPRRGVVDVADIARESFQPLVEEARDFRVRDRQGNPWVLQKKSSFRDAPSRQNSDAILR